MKKIKDNKTPKDLRDSAKQVKALKTVMSLLHNTGILKNDELMEKLSGVLELIEQTERITSLPDKFNEYFSSLGWIAFETLNIDLASECVDLAEQGKLKEAEEKLQNYFNIKDNLIIHLRWMNSIEEFQPRRELVELALSDHAEGRFYASIPVILLTIDGLVNDVAPQQKGFFATNPDVTEWDSIAGHSSGLKKIAEVFGARRKKTNSDELTLPYRNGILHGRDINYANPLVAAKTWLVLFAIGDWAKSVKRNASAKKREPEKEPTWKDIADTLLINKEQKKLLNDWSPRNLVVGQDFPEYGTVIDYAADSPEQRLVEFIEYWKKGNYGQMAKLTTEFSENTIGKKAAELRERFKDIAINSFRITEIQDTSPAISVIKVMMDYALNDNSASRDIEIRFIYQGPQNNPLARNTSGGQWQVMDGGFNTLVTV